MPSHEPIKLAIIGCGGIARAHLRGYIEIKRHEPELFKFVAMCDPVEERANSFAEEASQAQSEKIHIYTDIDEMLRNEELDAVDICTPHGLHHIHATKCMEAGAHVLLEKPVGVTIKAAKVIVEASKRFNKIAAIAEQCFRSLPARTAKWVIHECKLIGEPRLFYAQQVSWNPPPSEQNAPRWHWRVDRYLGGGGLVFDSGVHYIHTLRTLFGEVESVYAQVKQLQKRPHNKDGQIVYDFREDTWMAVLNFASGVVGFWSYTSAAPGHQFTHVVYYGTEGALIDSGDAFHGPFSGAMIHRVDGRVRRLSELQGEFLESLSTEQRKRLFPHNITDPFAIECYDFLDAIRSGRTPEVTAEDGMVDEAVAMAIYESATIGSQVKVKDVLDGKVETYQSDINAHWRL
ncbi:MAG: hypothetical protein HZRFUVUK_000067 [Candidatus Fervidibacterota bacterium]|jgi:predicted dehydrogenase